MFSLKVCWKKKNAITVASDSFTIMALYKSTYLLTYLLSQRRSKVNLRDCCYDISRSSCFSLNELYWFHPNEPAVQIRGHSYLFSSVIDRSICHKPADADAVCFALSVGYKNSLFSCKRRVTKRWCFDLGMPGRGLYSAVAEIPRDASCYCVHKCLRVTQDQSKEHPWIGHV